MRVVVYVAGGRIEVTSRKDRDITGGYPELRALRTRFPRRRVILDGEIVARDRRGRPSFSLLQQRMHVKTPTEALVERVPVQLYVFDLRCTWAHGPCWTRPISGGARCSLI